MTDGYRMDRPAALTCPECGGAMTEEKTGTLLRFRCHIGHLLTADAMLQAQFTNLEAQLAGCLVALKERAELCWLIIQSGSSYDKKRLEAAKRQAVERAEIIKELLEGEWIAQ
jgi:two-component system chemotaxis response regulator CheB